MCDELNVDYWETSYKRNILQRLWHDMRFKPLRRILGRLPNGSNILDVGCGSGFTIGKCIPGNKRFNVYGVETTKKQIAHSKKLKPDYDFKVGYGEKLPYESKKFDAVTYLDVIEHVTDPMESMYEVRRVLKDDGFVVIEVVKEHHPLFKIIWLVWTRRKGKVWHGTHLYVFDEKSVGEMLEKSGFKITSMEQIQLGMGLIAAAYKDKNWSGKRVKTSQLKHLHPHDH